MTLDKNNNESEKGNIYTCNEYREEMILASLQRALNRPDITVEEKKRLQKELQELEQKMGF